LPRQVRSTGFRRHPRNLRRNRPAPRTRCRPSKHWNDISGKSRPIRFEATRTTGHCGGTGCRRPPVPNRRTPRRIAKPRIKKAARSTRAAFHPDRADIPESGRVFVVRGVSYITTAICSSSLGWRQVPDSRRQTMSAHSAVLVQNISAVWLRNAFAGSLAGLVLVLLLILVP